MKKLLILGLWIPVALFTLFASFLNLYYLSQVKEAKVLAKMTVRELISKNEYQFYAAMPSAVRSFSSSIKSGDARPEILNQFVQKYNPDSELANLGKLAVAVSDENNLDFRLLWAIAMVESNLCKKIPQDSHNCWGYGIYGDKVTRFSSIEEAIRTVARGLKKNYVDHGLNTSRKIVAKYMSGNKERWQFATERFMKEMR